MRNSKSILEKNAPGIEKLIIPFWFGSLVVEKSLDTEDCIIVGDGDSA